MIVRKILAAIALLLIAFSQLGLPAMAATGVAGRVQLTDNTEATYVEMSDITMDPAASPTDVFTKAGSSTKTVYIQRVELFYYDSSAYHVPIPVKLIKRSTLDTGGTSTSATAVPYDSGFSAATSTAMKCFTANPSGLGTAVGDITSQWAINEPGVVGTQYNSTMVDKTPTRILFDHVRDNGPIVLRGTSENIAVNLGSTSIATTARMGCRIVYREK